jgi:hypothetical protein
MALFLGTIESNLVKPEKLAVLESNLMNTLCALDRGIVHSHKERSLIALKAGFGHN